eukprot:NODE_233_length_13658_cov_0.453647.p13 type:complete len:126 gc:universal NODE_233_length_13658_cov_0.453647:1234-857(-)
MYTDCIKVFKNAPLRRRKRINKIRFNINFNLQPPVMYSRLQTKLLTLNPTVIKLENSSHLHAHHAAMKNINNPESHFQLTLVSEEFKNKRALERHRLVYNLLDEEMKDIHALEMKLMTHEEFKKI